MHPTVPLFGIDLTLGLRTPSCASTRDDDLDDPLQHAERLIGGALNVPMSWGDDLELGGAFLEYAPSPPPPVGVQNVRVHPNNMERDFWVAPHRRDLPLVAQVALVSPSLLEAGRMAATLLEQVAGHGSLVSYAVVPPCPGAGGTELWRGHGAIFMTDRAAAAPWVPERPAVDQDIRWDESVVAPVHLGHVTFAMREAELAQALPIVKKVFPVAFVAGEEQDLGGAYFEHVGIDGSQLLLRRNQVLHGTWLFEDHKDVTYLFEVTMRTQNLLHLGRVATALEATGAFRAIAYRVIGDLLRDRVPRVLVG